MSTYDVAVIGLGAMGGAAAWQLLEGRTLPGLAALPDAAAAPALG